MTYITDEIEQAYGSLESYLNNGYGFAAVKDNEIVSRAIMTFLFKDKCNISVDTNELHRKKGLSSYLVSKTLDEALIRKQIPIWDCSEENQESERTALKCGFEIIREDRVSWFTI